MNYSVADAIAAKGGDAASLETGDISALLPYGIAPGAKAVMRKEKKAAEEALSTGIYVTWRSIKTGQDCARVGSMSRCFCGCTYERHTYRKGRTMPVCETCDCGGFDFVPSRPEEIGEWWLPRRPGFCASSWRAKCRCGHSHEAHHPSRRSCGSCKCGEFRSAYGCVVCDSHQEDHQTRVETPQDRVSMGRPVGRDYIPLSHSPELSRLTFGRRNRRSSADLAPCRTEHGGVAAAVRGGSGRRTDGGAAREKESHPSSLPPPAACDKVRRGRSFFSQSTGLPVVGCRGVSTRDVIGPGRALSSPSPISGGREAPLLSPTSNEEGEQPQRLKGFLRSNRPARGRGGCDDTAAASNIVSASPELLYASGRITAARYHEMLAGMDTWGPERRTTIGPRVRTRARREAGADGVGKTAHSQGPVR
ncbi:unnamed protein product [Scytosiphon promiscuus]